MKKLLLLLLAAVMVFSLAACGNNSDTNSDYDKEFTILVGGGDEWTPFENASGVTFENSADSIIVISDDGAKVEFTGLAVGESVITATYNGKEMKALVKVVTTVVNNPSVTSKPEGPGNTSGSDTETKRYITYNKPVEKYYIEFNGGYVEKNKNAENGNRMLVLAYEDKEFMSIGGYYDSDTLSGVMSTYQSRVGYEYIRYSEKKGDSYWISDTNNDSEEHRYEWVSNGYKSVIYPLGEFAAFASGMQTSSLADVAESSLYNLPDKVDVTDYYVRSEKVMNIMCDVYKYQTATWWVDPVNGFTMKMAVEGGDYTNNWEVTKLILRAPDWDGLHLCPQKGDTEDFFGDIRIFDD